MAKILIIFGSTSGNTEIVCQRVAEVLQADKHFIVVQRVEKSTVDEIKDYDLCILASPTYGHGVLEGHFITFHSKFIKENYNGQKFAVIGLGDFKYDADYHIESANILEKAIRDSNGELITDSLRVTKSPLRTINNLIPKWAENLSKIMSENV